jgi:hypothetical protein
MVKRRKLAWTGLFLLIAIIVASFNSSGLIGWWRGEAKYQGKYTNYWREELCAYQLWGYDRDPFYSHWTFIRLPSKLDRFLSNIGLSSSQAGIGFEPPLQYPEPDAVPVLIELLDSREQDVRILAANGLGNIGPKARDANPALLDASMDEDPLVAQAAREAIWAINPRSAAAKEWLKLSWTSDKTDALFFEAGALMLPQTPAGFGHLLREVVDRRRWLRSGPYLTIPSQPDIKR